MGFSPEWYDEYNRRQAAAITKRNHAASKTGSEDGSPRVEPNKLHAPPGSPPVQEAVGRRDRIGVLIVSYRWRFLDRDNLQGGSKYVIDGLRNSGYLADDDETSVETFYLQRKTKRGAGDERTEIYLFELT